MKKLWGSYFRTNPKNKDFKDNNEKIFLSELHKKCLLLT